MPSIFIFPFVVAFWLCAFVAYWVVVCVFLGTVALNSDLNGTLLSSMEVYGFVVPDIPLQWAFLFHFVGFIWTTEFIGAVAQTTIAGAVATWYWVKEKSNMPHCPVWRSFAWVFRYHLGSMAFGSLIITIIRLWRYFLEYCDHKVKKGKGTSCLRCCICFLRCFACCWEKVYRFIAYYSRIQIFRYFNSNAYIMIAIVGKSFCASGRHAIALKLKSPLKTTILAAISSFAMLLTKLFIACTCTLIASIIFYYSEKLHFWFVPSLFVFVIAWVISGLFTHIYQIAIQVIPHSLVFLIL